MLKELRTAVVAALAFTALLGIAYPLAMTGASRLLFPERADGSFVEVGGRTVGSRLIGQSFQNDPAYFQSRPSATRYSPSATFFNNLGPNQRDLSIQIEQAVRKYLERERPYTPGLVAAGIPSDAVTTSASGVDPDISEDNALIQANRIAEERGLDRARILALIRDNSSRPLFGLAGEKSINVLELNIALDEEAA